MRLVWLCVLLLAALWPVPTTVAAGDLTCDLFVVQEDAQAVLDANPGSRAALDPDGNGRACDDLPARHRGPRQQSTSVPPTMEPQAGIAAASPAEVSADIDRFWAAHFAAAGLPYWAPGAILPYQPGATVVACTVPARYVAFYCPTSDTIYYDAGARAATLNQWHDATGWAVILAHEWGHHLQSVRGLVQQEDQADCLAGAYLVDAAGRGWISQASADTLLAAYRAQPQQTGAPFVLGATGGVAACGLLPAHP